MCKKSKINYVVVSQTPISFEREFVFRCYKKIALGMMFSTYRFKYDAIFDFECLIIKTEESFKILN